MFAEPPVVPRTVTDLQGIGLYVEILTVFIGALSKLLKEVADWHFCHVVLVEKFAIVPFLAQVPQPVLTDNSALTTNVAKRAMAATSARAAYEELA